MQVYGKCGGIHGARGGSAGVNVLLLTLLGIARWLARGDKKSRTTLVSFGINAPALYRQ